MVELHDFSVLDGAAALLHESWCMDPILGYLLHSGEYDKSGAAHEMLRELLLFWKSHVLLNVRRGN